MDNEKNQPEPLKEEEWFEEILSIRQAVGEITADDSAVLSEDLTRPDDLELERIVQETLAENWFHEPAPVQEEKETDATQLFSPQDLYVPAQEPVIAEPIPEAQDMQQLAFLTQESFGSELPEALPEPELSVAPEGPEQDDPLAELAALLADMPEGEAVMAPTPEQEIETEAQQLPEPEQALVQETAPEDVPQEEPYVLPVQEPVAEQTALPVEEIPEVAVQESQPEEETPAPEEEPRKSKPRKRRPKMKKGYGLFGLPHLAVTAVWLALVIAIGVSLGNFLWICAADVLAFGKEPMEATVVITQEDLAPLNNEDPADDADAAKNVATKLKEAGLIKNDWLFEFFSIKLTSKIENISPGTYDFYDTMIYDYNALIKVMTDYGPAAEVVEIMFPEGYTCAQMFQLLEDNGVCTVADMEAYVVQLKTHIDNQDFKNYWFLNGIPLGHKYSLEGYLAPDTYQFYKNDEPGKVLEKFLDKFDANITDNGLNEKLIELNQRMREQMKANGYTDAQITNSELSFHEAVILASIVEKETSGARESYTIASVFFNRLCDPSRYPKLESDATVLYAIDYYNKGELTTDELINASPYNTYTHDGLTPTPIANPGLNSLGAALSPEETEPKYYFFILDKEAQEHKFSATLEEHERLEEELGYHDDED